MKNILHIPKALQSSSMHRLLTCFKVQLFFIMTLFCSYAPSISGAEICSLPAYSEEEALFLNRIADFWEEGEYAIAKHQIQEFIALYPNSPFSDILHTAIGEIFLQEKNYSAALDAYARIKDAQIAKTTFPHRIECLYNMQWYPILTEECESFLQNATEETPYTDEITCYLAMGLYNQCIVQESLEPKEKILELAKKAEPYFVKTVQNQNTPEIEMAYAHILWRLEKIPQAAEIYRNLAKQHPEIPEIQREAAAMQLELIQFAQKKKEWALCRESARTFLAQFTDHPQEETVRNVLIYASSELSQNGALEKDWLLLDLKEYGNNPLLLAKTEFSLHHYDEAVSILESLLAKGENREAELLLALCYRDHKHDLDTFCNLAEKALQNEPTFLSKDDLHIALYNAYLELENPSAAEAHLFALFQRGKVDPDNLLWLSNRYFERRHEEEAKQKAIAILETLPPSSLAIAQLSTLYAAEGQREKAISLLESVAAPTHEITLLLAEQFIETNNKEKALKLLQTIPSTNLRGKIEASAALHRAQLQIEKWEEISSTDPQEIEHTLAELKNLTIQKNIAHEPIYLEAALEYIDLQNRCHRCPTKNLLLLQKIKKDFENMDDLLSKDYHKAREGALEKNRIYQSYIHFFDASILMTQMELEKEEERQKELQAKAKDLLLKVIEEQASPALVARAERCLNR